MKPQIPLAPNAAKPMPNTPNTLCMFDQQRTLTKWVDVKV
jgi:hypothetical protein